MPTLSEKREVITTAALRAAVAWSRREEEQRAWREVARMTGVVMYALGPGSGPVTPAELVALLRQPLRKLLPPADDRSPIEDVILLGPGDQLSDDALDIACDYNHALFDVRDPGTEWLPGWAWQRAEQVERQMFQNLSQAGDETVYTSSRRFVIERPSGVERELTDERTKSPRYAGARLVAGYGPIPADRVFRYGPAASDVCWWPCPICQWPMHVHDPIVRCAYGPHEASFRISARGTSGSLPKLVRTSVARLKTPGAQDAADAVCVDPAVWRFITVPGVPELLLERQLQAIPGVTVKMWPIQDAYDLLVTTPDGRPWRIDVKDHVAPDQIVRRPPAAEYVVVPRYRKGQVPDLRRMLPGKQVKTLDGFVSHISAYVAKGNVA